MIYILYLGVWQSGKDPVNEEFRLLVPEKREKRNKYELELKGYRILQQYRHIYIFYTLEKRLREKKFESNS